ncbi:hypothetical protein BRYFOR_08846 [Marvinbryantia formatexigens DSM 14469]|uniref:Uncharacterized protein n=1 Tax=Marvinbryantia formatexigens DSM 14469 TaxID=478749 RepID=C6LJK9_9FIRM|nr:hypothetical protein BRYFOR_08846 [Marvinbryantia formatexigens DSM 14469]
MICYNDFTFQKIWRLAKISVMNTTGIAARASAAGKISYKNGRRYEKGDKSDV